MTQRFAKRWGYIRDEGAFRVLLDQDAPQGLYRVEANGSELTGLFGPEAEIRIECEPINHAIAARLYFGDREVDTMWLKVDGPRDSLDQAIEYAAEHLPDGFNVVVDVERNAGNVKTLDPSGGDQYFYSDDGLADAVVDAVDWAIEQRSASNA